MVRVICFTIVSSLFLFSKVYAQSLYPNLIGGNSGWVSDSSNSFYISIGEPLFTVLNENESQIFQGFLQPWNSNLSSLITYEDDSSVIFRFYPNPVKDVLFVERKTKKSLPAKFSIFDVYGKQIKSFVTQARITEINFSEFIRGAYTLQIEIFEKNLITRKIIKI